MLLARPKLVINSSREKLYSLILKIKLEILPYSLLNQLRELGVLSIERSVWKAWLFSVSVLLDIINELILYCMINYKLIFKNWSEYIWLAKKKYFLHVIRVRYSTKEDKPAGWQIVNRIKRCVKRRSKTRFFSSWPRSVNIGMQRMQAFCGLGWATE